MTRPPHPSTPTAAPERLISRLLRRARPVASARALRGALFTAPLLAIAMLATAQPALAADSRDYAALGDSYSSGLGTGSYYSDSGSCKRSSKAYPVLWANAKQPASFKFVACAGAKTTDVINGQLSSLSSSTDLISISVGGNDASFGDTMRTCATSSEATCLAEVDKARTYIKNTLPGKLNSVYSEIKKKAPNAKVVVMGYSRLYKVPGSCNAGLSDKSRTAINAAADDLATVTSGRAAAAGFTFGDVRSPFTNHEICSSDWWLNSVILTDTSESYHPNAAGQSKGYHPAFSSKAG